MTQIVDKLKEILARDDIREVYNIQLETAKEKGVDFNNFNSILSNVKVIRKIGEDLYDQGIYFKFGKSIQDELIFDGSDYHAPGLGFSIYPEFETFRKIECYAERVVEANLDIPQVTYSVEHKEGCLYITDCRSEVVLNTILEIVNHNINECNKQFNFSTPFDADIAQYVKDYKESIGLSANLEQGTEL